MEILHSLLMLLAFVGGAFCLWVGMWLGSKSGVYVPPPPMVQKPAPPLPVVEEEKEREQPMPFVGRPE